jgi:hypothetical protein
MSLQLREYFGMPKPTIPEFIPVSPVTLACPLCAAKPGKDCHVSSGGNLPVVHLARIRAAAKMDIAEKKRRREKTYPTR